jgi:hypothetical protein
MWRVAARPFGLIVCLLVLSPATGAGLDAQAVPQPFPRPSGGGDKSAPVQQPQPAGTPPTSAPAPVGAPSEATLGVPIYPGATFIASYNAGQGQRYYLFGSTASFADLVAYYRNALKTRGELVYEEPATHMFDVGRFREESMAFPPSVTIKDYLWGGTGGYLNPNPAAQPKRFPTIIQIVPAPAATR